MLEMALAENIQRADLNPLEEADAYRHLIDDFGLTQERQRGYFLRGLMTKTKGVCYATSYSG